MDAAGDFVVSWISDLEDGSDWGVYAHRYNSSGVAQGNEFRVNTYTTGNQGFFSTGNTGQPPVAMDAAGDFIVAWSSYAQDGSSYGIYAQRYLIPQTGASVTPLGGPLGSLTFGTASPVAMDLAGDYVVVSVQSNYLVAQTFNASNVPEQYTNITASSTATYHDLGVAMDAAGDFVVSWTLYGPGGSSYGVFAQRDSAASVAQGSIFQVNSYTADAPFDSVVAMDSVGDFVIAWADVGEDGSGAGVYAQRYNAAGVAQGSQFQVNSYTTGNQLSPSVAMDAEGDFVVAWSSYLNDPSEGISAQLYNAAGVAQGSELLVNSYTTGRSNSPRWPWISLAISWLPG